MKETVELQIAGLSLDAASPIPLYRQLYEALRQMILAGRLRPGQRLPATRELSAQLNCSRNTILNAYDCLLAEGYVEGLTGSGTYVSQGLPQEMTHLPLATAEAGAPGLSPAEIAPVESGGPRLARPNLLSQQGRTLIQTPISPDPPPDTVQPFRHGLPALADFPHQLWARLMAGRWRELERAWLGYNDPAGYPPLREAIAAYLRTSRAVNCQADQVIIINGAQQGLHLAARLLLDPGDPVWLEDPGYLGARAALTAAGADLIPLPVDGEGLKVEAGLAAAPRARLAYVTPSHQYPLGVTMSLKRRFQLLNWAEQAGAWILEDDYDSEFRYQGHPLASLQGLDYGQRVIYLGTFSKVLFPALRLGYLVVPPDLARPFVAARSITDRGSAIIEQATLAEFMAEGHFARHIRRMRLRYQARQQAVLSAAARHLPGLLDLQPSPAGMHLVGWLPEDSDDCRVSQKLAQAGLVASPLSAYTFRHPVKPGLLLGYTAFAEQELKTAVRRMGQALRGILGDIV
jgi:GntR family transcriptional regulator/MocR family aminotransferase